MNIAQLHQNLSTFRLNLRVSGKRLYLDEIWLESYQEARLQAADETELAIAC